MSHIVKRLEMQSGNGRLSSTRELSRTIGHIVSLRLPIRDDAIFMTRFMQMAVANAKAWDMKFYCDESAEDEFLY